VSATLPESTEAPKEVELEELELDKEVELEELELELELPPPPQPTKKAKRNRLIPNFEVDIFIGFLLVCMATSYS
jgi:hypothetical protein